MPIYSIGRTTVNDMKRDAAKTEKHTSKMESPGSNIKVRKTMKLANLDQLDTVVHQWFIQARSQDIQISGLIIMAKAIEIKKKISGDLTSKASMGWLYRFCFIDCADMDISGEKLSADSSVIAE